MGICNTLNDISNRACVSNKTEDLNLSVFNMITGINELKILTRHISCECKCKFEGTKCNSNQKRNNDRCRCECKNPKEHNAREKDYVWNPATCSCKNGERLASAIDDSVITCDDIINAADSLSTNVPENVMSTASINFHNKKVGCKMDCHILHSVLLVIIFLFIIAIMQRVNQNKKILTH